jgi:type IV/VI secretion system ImpK/VasF family protein
MYIGRKIRLNFQEFYYTLLHQFKKACTEIKPSDEEVIKVVTDIQTPLLKCLKDQLVSCQEDFFGDQRKDLTRGIYLAASLGDELHLNHTWFGRDAWKANMLEHQLFQTQTAGEQIPTDVDEIIQKPQNYPEELLEIYFLLLVLGFKGRFTASQMNLYKKRMLSILFPTAAFLYDQRQTELIPGHASSVISSSGKHHFLDTRRWILGAFGFMILFTLTTTYFWYDYHKDVGIITHQLDLKTLRIRAL